MTRTATARAVALVTALVVLAGVITQLHATSQVSAGFFDTSTKRVLNVFCFFTILSNLLLGATNALLAVDPKRRGTVFAGLRLAGVISMVVTGVVFHAALRGLQDLHGSAQVADTILHTVDPILALVSWLAVGPRGAIDRRVVGVAIVYPVAWLVFTLIRGAAIGFYPYPFLDVAVHGYLRVVVNCVVVAVLFLALAATAAAIDRRLPGRQAATT